MKRLFLIPFLFLFQQLVAQEQGKLTDTLSIAEVQVQSTFNSGISLNAVGSISRLSTALLQSNHQLNLSDYLHFLPGVVLHQGSHTTSRLVVRGIGSRTPYSSNRIRAYYGDIPLTDGNGETQFEDLGLLETGYLEVLKGPASARFGSGLGGVFRIVPAFPEVNKLRIQAETRVGSFGLFKNGIQLSLRQGAWRSSLSVSQDQKRGFRENNQHKRNNLTWLNWYSNEKLRIQTLVQVISVNAQIASSINQEMFQNRPESAAPNWQAVSGFENYTRWRAGLSSSQLIKNKWRNRMSVFGMGNQSLESRPFNFLNVQTTSVGARDELHYSVSKADLRMGGEVFYEWYHWETHETLNGVQGPLITQNHEIRNFTNAFVLTEFRPTQELKIEAGVNLHFLQYRLSSSLKYSYQPIWSPRLGLSYLWFPENQVYLSLGHGFSAPSLEETLLPDGRRNLALKPETGLNLDLGFKGILKPFKLWYDISFYSIFVRDLLVTQRISESLFMGVNAGKSQHSGIEGSFRLPLYRSTQDQGPTVLVNVSGAYTAAVFKEFIDLERNYAGNYLPGLPRSNVLLGIELNNWQQFSFFATWRMVGSQFLDDANTIQEPAYQLLDLSTKRMFSLKKIKFELFSGVRNLTNSHYASMILINAPSFGGRAPRYYYPGEPRNYFLGFKVLFDN